MSNSKTISPSSSSSSLSSPNDDGVAAKVEASPPPRPVSPSECRIYTQDDLAVLNLLEQPVWIFDIVHKSMWWANAAAVTLWSAPNLESLLQRNFSDDMSESTKRRLDDYLVQFRRGDKLMDQWTFYPNGNGPKTVATTASGIHIDDDDDDSRAAGEEKKRKGQRMAMLVEGVYKDVMDESDKASLRGVEILRHLPIAVCQFDILGNVMDQNPEALAVFGSLGATSGGGGSKGGVGASNSGQDASSTAPTECESDCEGLSDCEQDTEREGGGEAPITDNHTETSTSSSSAATKLSDPETKNEKKDGVGGQKKEKKQVEAEGTNNDNEKGTGECHFLSRFVDKELGRQVLNQVREGHDTSIEALQHTTSGPRWAAIKVRKAKDPVSTCPVILYSARDITEVVEALKAKRQADMANTAKSEFLAVMAHEIRTPLHQVTGFIELMGSTILNEEQAEFLKLMKTSSSSLMCVINDLLDYTKLESGNMTLEAVSFDVRSVFDGALSVVQPKCDEKGIELQGMADRLIPEEIVGDPNRLRQILLNLLQNAVKFTHHGSIKATVSRVTDPVDSGAGSGRKGAGTAPEDDTTATKKRRTSASRRTVLRFAVTDTGIGINEESRKRMFGKYQQADASVAAKYGGTGLGLNICKRLTEAMGGQIGLDSRLGEGSSFWFEIPFDCHCDSSSSSSSTSSSPISKRKSGSLPRSRSSTNLGCQQVLLVEDNKINQKVMSAMLKRLGHSVTIADNGLKAVHEIESNVCGYDVVLMDVQMPVMDGIEATKRIRALGYSKEDLPIMGLTASMQRDDHQELGMNDWLIKPLKVKDLKEAIKRCSKPIIQ